MSNKNMDWNHFLTEYMVRAMTNYQIFEEYKVQQMVEFARKAWDAMQAAELPESEKAKQESLPSFVLTDAIALIPSNSMELKRLAELAAAKGFSWVAQDGVTQQWYGYTTEPEYQECSQEWRPTSNNFEELKLPDATDYSKQIFNVNELLNNEQ